jgi:hypothetical protein
LLLCINEGKNEDKGNYSKRMVIVLVIFSLCNSIVWSESVIKFCLGNGEKLCHLRNSTITLEISKGAGTLFQLR